MLAFLSHSAPSRPPSPTSSSCWLSPPLGGEFTFPPSSEPGERMHCHCATCCVPALPHTHARANVYAVLLTKSPWGSRSTLRDDLHPCQHVQSPGKPCCRRRHSLACWFLTPTSLPLRCSGNVAAGPITQGTRRRLAVHTALSNATTSLLATVPTKSGSRGPSDAEGRAQHSTATHPAFSW